MNTEVITVEFKAAVASKYAPMIRFLLSENTNLFQEICASWIDDARLQAAKAGVEVDEVLAHITNEVEAQAKVSGL